MAVDQNNKSSGAAMSAGRRFLVGSNVVLSIVLLVGIVGVLQAIAFMIPPTRVDMTSSGINSLSEGTESLLRSLDGEVRISSLYFQTDLEDPDQARYRQAVDDLLQLYKATNRSKIVVESINPLADHDRFAELKSRLKKKTEFKGLIEQYDACIDTFKSDVQGQAKSLIQAELARIGELGSGMGDEQTLQTIVPVQQRLQEWSAELQVVAEQVDIATAGELPQYSAVVDEIKALYGSFSQSLANIAEYGTAAGASGSRLPEAQADFLTQAADRYQDVISLLDEKLAEADALERLTIDDLVRELSPTANAILVETNDTARVVDFSSVWPAIRQVMPGYDPSFNDRAFKGEEKLTAAILRVTYKQQTAVVFVRYGGPSLFNSGSRPGQPAAPLAMMRQQLEDANFLVSEWDLKVQDQQPAIDPPPTKTIYVVLKPNAPERGPMGQPTQDPPFGEGQRKAILDAIEREGRALFVTGWTPGPFGSMPSSYEYRDYLRDDWGIDVDSSVLLIQAVSIGPGKYGFSPDTLSIGDLVVSDHEIVSGSAARRLILPHCAPLMISENLPEGTDLVELVRADTRDGLWGAKDVQKYAEQSVKEHVEMVEGDDEGPFILAMAGTKGEAKTVVISSSTFALDQIAFAQEMSLGAQGITVRSKNPGNVALLVNSLHWLSDNRDFINIGQPIDTAVLAIPNPATVTWVKGITIFAWPVLAIGCGLIMWTMRRR